MSTTIVAEDAVAPPRQLARAWCLRTDFAAAARLLSDGGRVSFDEVWGSACALLTAALGELDPSPLLLILPKAADLESVCDDLRLFGARPVLPFPAWETEVTERVVHDEIHGDRLRVLKHLLPHDSGERNSALAKIGSGPFVVAASVPSLLQPTPARATIAGSSRRVAVGQRLEMASLARWLAEKRFHATNAVELPGEFSVRGGILDLFAADWEWPVRIEWLDDQIESIRQFEIATQRSQDQLAAVEITVLAPATGNDGCLIDYLPPRSRCLVIEPEQAAEEAHRFLTRVEDATALHSFSAIMQRLKSYGLATVHGIGQGGFGDGCSLRTESVERFSGEVGRVRGELEKVAADDRTIVVAPTAAELERVAKIFADSPLLAGGQLQFVVGRLANGFRIPDQRTIIVSTAEMFHRSDLRRSGRRRLGKAIDRFLDLNPGDLVVHLSHGIGRYRGIELIDKQGRQEEHLQIEFHGGAKLYVPATKIDLVQKYIGGGKSRPTLAKLGNTGWQRQKDTVQRAVMDMAVEMIELQAERLSRPGIAFAPDGEWQREFDASFIYDETPDQLAAIAEIKQDMQSPRPMERLLCGDVGFGKTEVAMRAAFKAIDNGYQVAVLVPTTILAEQHYRTFTERMAEFPFDIARLSRFCAAAQEREILAGLAAGRIDIVIGTHRLASRDVAFHNLGLLIIDEEQRFGVEVKERLKALRSTIDILTLSATPIPRTLHMSLVGVRDISNLESAPEERVAIETRLTRFSHELIRHAVLRELNRGGQIFFVHNRIEDIDIVARKLRMVVPEASLRIAHGRMQEDELEQVMLDFVAGRFDLLLATTIVESGLDIPNANTIFIDEAQRYGLADLHQLRGRVGRYKHRAYCYLLVDSARHLTPNAAKRLRAIEEYSEMGAGFALAMRDLEIRGAGNLLGTQQSGHIAVVGYEFYCQLLEDAVRSLKRLPRRLAVDVDLDLPGCAYIPDDYVPDLRAKIDLYRRLRRLACYDELAEYRRELIDRFGPIPLVCESLLDLAELRMDAAVWQIGAISTERDFVVFQYANAHRMQQLARETGRRLRIVDQRTAYLPAPGAVQQPALYLAAAKSVLRRPPGKPIIRAKG